MGPVKNRCKNGDHYWVSAFVTPIKDAHGKVVEYQSVRTAPSEEIKQRAERIYAGLRADKARWRSGCRPSPTPWHSGSACC